MKKRQKLKHTAKLVHKGENSAAVGWDGGIS